MQRDLLTGGELLGDIDAFTDEQRKARQTFLATGFARIGAPVSTLAWRVAWRQGSTMFSSRAILVLRAVVSARSGRASQTS
jgi:hypothetical protein